MTRDKQDALIEAWKQSVVVQKHFNELILNIRERAITVLGAGLVATAFLIKEEYVLAQPIRWAHLLTASLYIVTIVVCVLITLYRERNKLEQVGTIVSKDTATKIEKWLILLVLPYIFIFIIYLWLRRTELFGDSSLFAPVVESPSIGGLTLISLSFVWLAFYLLDRFWYHRLLKGAVNHGIVVEAALVQDFPEFCLGENISIESSVYPKVFNTGVFSFLRIDSNSKLDIFYYFIFLTLFSIGIILLKQPTEILRGGEKQQFSVNLLPIPVDSINKINTMNDSLKKVNQILEYRVLELETKNRIDSLLKNRTTISPKFPAGEGL